MLLDHLLLPLFLAIRLWSVQAPVLPGHDSPTIKVTTRLLQVNVAVFDKKGDPVADLTKDDFVLYDKGQQQKIRYFAKEANDAPSQDVPPQGEGAVSNRFVTFEVDGKLKVQALPDSLTVILLDGLNTKFTDQKNAKEAIIHFLKQIHPGDQVAIYTLTDSLRVLHDFTADTAELLAALEAHRNSESSAVAASSYADAHEGGNHARELEAVIDRGNKLIAGYTVAHRAATTMMALQAIANHLAGLPGRKNLIWVSGGFPVPVGAVNGGALRQEARALSGSQPSAWRVFNDVGLAIYPVDARGLLGMIDWMPSTDGRYGGVGHGESPMDRRAQIDINESHLTMTALAEGTGGRACLNNNDIAGCIGRAMNDARVTYALYFTPTHDEWDGKFREIKIKLNRPGLDAHYRKGYYAMPDLPADQQTRHTLLAEAGLSPLPSTGLMIVAKLLEKPTEAAPHAALSVVMDGHEFAFSQNAKGEQEATVDLLILPFGDQPAPLGETARRVHLALKPEQYDVLMKGGVRVTVVADAPLKTQRVRVVARDAASGTVGSVDVPIK
jgi:VWFA-related protein